MIACSDGRWVIVTGGKRRFMGAPEGLDRAGRYRLLPPGWLLKSPALPQSPAPMHMIRLSDGRTHHVPDGLDVDAIAETAALGPSQFLVRTTGGAVERWSLDGASLKRRRIWAEGAAAFLGAGPSQRYFAVERAWPGGAVAYDIARYTPANDALQTIAETAADGSERWAGGVWHEAHAAGWWVTQAHDTFGQGSYRPGTARLLRFDARTEEWSAVAWPDGYPLPLHTYPSGHLAVGTCRPGSARLAPRQAYACSSLAILSGEDGALVARHDFDPPRDLSLMGHAGPVLRFSCGQSRCTRMLLFDDGTMVQAQHHWRAETALADGAAVAFSSITAPGLFVGWRGEAGFQTRPLESPLESVFHLAPNFALGEGAGGPWIIRYDPSFARALSGR